MTPYDTLKEDNVRLLRTDFRSPQASKRAGSEFAVPLLMACPIALVAEDDAELRDLIANALSRAGFDVRKARDGLELLANTAIPEALPDVIITDVEMPRCNGLSALGAVHRFAPQIPSIVMTSFADQATCAEARRFGAQLVIDKPFDVGMLCAAARELVENRNTVPMTLPVLDVEMAMPLVVGLANAKRRR